MSHIAFSFSESLPAALSQQPIPLRPFCRQAAHVGVKPFRDRVWSHHIWIWNLVHSWLWALLHDGKSKTTRALFAAVLLYHEVIEVIGFSGYKQEEHHSPGVLGENASKTVLHSHHDKERFCYLHMGFPEDQSTIRCECLPPHYNFYTLNTVNSFFIFFFLKRMIGDCILKLCFWRAEL